MTSANAKQDATRVTLVGMWLDLLLGIGKIIGGLMTQSFALVTDGIHSLTDAITDIFVLIVARISHTAADEEHPYGHGRFETLGTIAMGIVFFITAGILLYDSIQRLRDSQDLPVPAIWGIAIALFSIASKEWIYQYTMRVARRLNSNLLRANAWHSRSDAMSSVAVLVGLVAAQLGYIWMDTVAAIFVALMIAMIGWELCVDSLKELVDTAIPPQRRRQLEACILETTGITGISSLRSRLSGGKILLEAQLAVNPRISVSEGHQLGEGVSRNLLARFSDVGDVVVHIDPQSSEEAAHSPNHKQQLPDRSEVISNIKRHWQNLLPEDNIERLDLHYLEQGIEIDLVVTLDEISNTLASQLEQAIQGVEHISKLRIYRKLSESKNAQQLS
jgi:cation diffusion facilitator family transporter